MKTILANKYRILLLLLDNIHSQKPGIIGEIFSNKVNINVFVNYTASGNLSGQSSTFSSCTIHGSSCKIFFNKPLQHYCIKAIIAIKTCVFLYVHVFMLPFSFVDVCNFKKGTNLGRALFCKGRPTTVISCP